MTEAYTSFENTLRFYGGTMNNKLVNGSQVPFNFELIGKTYRGSSAADYLTQITNWVNSMPKRDGIYANWVVRAHFKHFVRLHIEVAINSYANIFGFSWEITITNVSLPDTIHHEPI